MATGQIAKVVPPLGDLCTVEVDSTWPHLEAWASAYSGNPIGPKLSFAFVDLESGFSESAQPNYAVTEVVGRAEQYQTYINTGNREIDLTFRFHAQGLREFADTAVTRVGGQSEAEAERVVQRERLAQILTEEVVNPAIWLEALKHPVVAAVEAVGDSSRSFGPPPVMLKIGRLLYARCVVTQSTLTWQAPFDPETLLPFAAEVQVTFVVVRKHIQDNLFRHRRSYT